MFMILSMREEMVQKWLTQLCGYGPHPVCVFQAMVKPSFGLWPTHSPVSPHHSSCPLFSCPPSTQQSGNWSNPGISFLTRPPTCLYSFSSECFSLFAEDAVPLLFKGNQSTPFFPVPLALLPRSCFRDSLSLRLSQIYKHPIKLSLPEPKSSRNQISLLCSSSKLVQKRSILLVTTFSLYIHYLIHWIPASAPLSLIKFKELSLIKIKELSNFQIQWAFLSLYHTQSC